MTTITTLFSGGEGVGCGARMAGVVHLDGFEIDDDIAQVARSNNFDTTTADILTVDPQHLRVPDILHASPVCTNASVANANGEEAELDIATATKTAEFIEVMKPKFFTLENVYPYRHFKSFHIICDALTRSGYSWDYWHLNSADYGVPQTRKRLILIAKLDGGHNRIAKPEPTHHNPAKFDDNQMTLFAPTTRPWVGWYEAIEDLIPFLPESQFAPWQLERLPEWVGSKCDEKYTCPDCNKPDIGWVELPNDLIVDGKLNNHCTELTNRDGESPTFTVTTSHNNRDVKALITSGGNTYTPTLPDGEHGFTIGASHKTHGNHRALLFDDGNSKNGCVKDATVPMATVRTAQTGGTMARAWLQQGRVVQMTPRALARFQSFPEWYRFPDKNSLAGKVIGNAVPPLLAQRMIEATLL